MAFFDISTIYNEKYFYISVRYMTYLCTNAGEELKVIGKFISL